MKRIFASLITSGVFALFSPTISALTPAPCQPFTGLIVGVDGGVYQSQLKVEQDLLLIYPGILTERIFRGDSTKVSDVAGTIGVILGYAQSLNPCWVLGIEGRGNWANLKINDTINAHAETVARVDQSLGLSLKLRQQYGILAKLGYKPDPQILVYGLIGPELGSFDLKTDLGFDFTLTQQSEGTTHVVGQLGADDSFRQWGCLLGLGMEYLMCPNISVGLEYNFIQYGTLNFRKSENGMFINNGVVAPGSLTQMNHEFRMRNNAVLMRFTYYPA